MASPFNYTISSFIISNIEQNSDDSDNDFQEENDSNNYEENISEISFPTIPTDMSMSTIESDFDDHESEISTQTDGDSVIYESVNEHDDQENSISTSSDSINDELNEPQPKKIKLDENEQTNANENDLSQNCPICLAPFTNQGNHRLCSLRCGHLFGYQCIKQWLNSDNRSARKCPQCKARASKRHIRFIYANKLTSVDNSELEKIKKEIDEAKLQTSKLLKALHKQKQRTRKYKRLFRAKSFTNAANTNSSFSD